MLFTYSKTNMDYGFDYIFIPTPSLKGYKFLAKESLFLRKRKVMSHHFDFHA